MYREQLHPANSHLQGAGLVSMRLMLRCVLYRTRCLMQHCWHLIASIQCLLWLMTSEELLQSHAKPGESALCPGHSIEVHPCPNMLGDSSGQLGLLCTFMSRCLREAAYSASGPASLPQPDHSLIAGMKADGVMLKHCPMLDALRISVDLPPFITWVKALTRFTRIGGVILVSPDILSIQDGRLRSRETLPFTAFVL